MLTKTSKPDARRAVRDRKPILPGFISRRLHWRAVRHLSRLVLMDDHFSGSEKLFVDFLFTRSIGARQRYLKQIVWNAARNMEKAGQHVDALRIDYALISRTSVHETQLLIALQSALKWGDENLIATVLQQLERGSLDRERDLPVPPEKTNWLARLLKSILKNFWRRDELDRIAAFVTNYLTNKHYLELIADYRQLKGLIGALNKAGYADAAATLQKLQSNDAMSRHIVTAASNGRTDDRIFTRYVSSARAVAAARAEGQLEDADVTSVPAGKTTAEKALWRLLSAEVIGRGSQDALQRFIDEVEPEAAASDRPDFAPGNLQFLVQTLADVTRNLIKIEEFDHARDLAEAVCAKLPFDPKFLIVQAEAEKWSGNLENASQLYTQALKDPDCNPQTYFELAEVLELLEDDDGAISAIETGLELCSEDSLFVENPGYLTLITGPKLRKGDLTGAWEARLNRRDRYTLGEKSPREIWDNSSTEAKSVLVIGEAGVGDELKYATCYNDMKKVVREMVVSTDPRLVPLFERSFPEIEFIGMARPAPDKGWKEKSLESKRNFRISRAIHFELCCLLTSFKEYVLSGDLPLHFRRSRADFGDEKGYLVADPERRSMWRERLDALGPGLKVGISWRSRSQNHRRNQNYFSLEELMPVLSVPGIHFVNLQYDDSEAELLELETKHGIPIHRWSDTDLQDDFDGVAALIRELDLVVSVHTMVKELAGAVGAPTLLMTPNTKAAIRWRADPDTGEDIWHRSITHVQSEKFADKQDVVEKTKSRLEALVDERKATADWKIASTGMHRVSNDPYPQEDSAEQEHSAEIYTVLPPIENEYGEVFEPAGVRDFPNRYARQRELNRREQLFNGQVDKIFHGAVQQREPEGVLLVFGLSLKQHSFTALASHALLERNWASVCLDERPFEFGDILDPDIAHFRGILVKSKDKKSGRLFHLRGQSPELRFEWQIDWEQRICRAEGMNFYAVIANRLGKEFRRYSTDLENPDVRKRFDILLKTCDAALAVCIDAERRLAKKGMKVRFTGYEPNYPPTGVFKVYCGDRGHKHGIEFVEIKAAYEKYYKGGKAGMVTALSCQNVTRHNLYSAAGLRPDQFDRWFEKKCEDMSVIEQAQQWATQNRSGSSEPTAEGKIVLRRIEAHRAKGGKVACLYGCVPFDFGHPWLDTGPAHFDLKDWYNHTVSTLANHPDILLLIKPHPTEAYVEQIGQPDEYFVEMLDDVPPENAIVLGHRWVNNADLIPLLDYGIAWRGSIATELALLGVPVLICAPYSMTDHVLEFPMPKDRKDYEHMIQNPERITLSDELKQRASMVFEFYRSEAMVPYTFGWFPSKAKDAGVAMWSDAALDAYLADGHPSIDEICNRIISDPEQIE